MNKTYVTKETIIKHYGNNSEANTSLYNLFNKRFSNLFNSNIMKGTILKIKSNCRLIEIKNINKITGVVSYNFYNDVNNQHLSILGDDLSLYTRNRVNIIREVL